eukprot:CAMPEP_0118932406 /NCGR_PEP_ID=MMETSP1169-20130426/10133_1 /TAXON_ID=36882 /ORGANISM="Pyramimonas obovata, Strain CCMP722" /LENGTH=737 /DNA_ID=CAMNT_0006875057 /DNA_START=53 /DNA_END=2266 /DNA_ORIENTATION=+
MASSGQSIAATADSAANDRLWKGWPRAVKPYKFFMECTIHSYTSDSLAKLGAGTKLRCDIRRGSRQMLTKLSTFKSSGENSFGVAWNQHLKQIVTLYREGDKWDSKLYKLRILKVAGGSTISVAKATIDISKMAKLDQEGVSQVVQLPMTGSHSGNLHITLKCKWKTQATERELTTTKSEVSDTDFEVSASMEEVDKLVPVVEEEEPVDVAKMKAEKEAKLKAETAKAEAEAATKAKAEAEAAKAKAEAETAKAAAKAKAEAEAAKAKAEAAAAKAKAEAEAKAKAEALRAAEEQARKKAGAAAAKARTAPVQPKSVAKPAAKEPMSPVMMAAAFIVASIAAPKIIKRVKDMKKKVVGEVAEGSTDEEVPAKGGLFKLPSMPFGKKKKVDAEEAEETPAEEPVKESKMKMPFFGGKKKEVVEEAKESITEEPKEEPVKESWFKMPSFGGKAKEEVEVTEEEVTAESSSGSVVGKVLMAPVKGVKGAAGVTVKGVKGAANVTVKGAKAACSGVKTVGGKVASAPVKGAKFVGGVVASPFKRGEKAVMDAEEEVESIVSKVAQEFSAPIVEVEAEADAPVETSSKFGVGKVLSAPIKGAKMAAGAVGTVGGMLMSAPAKGLEGVKGSVSAVGGGVTTVGGAVAGGLISLPVKTVGALGGAAKKLMPKRSKKRAAYQKGVCQGVEHKVVKADVLWSLAKEYETTPAQILADNSHYNVEWRNDKREGSEILAGEVLCILKP